MKTKNRTSQLRRIKLDDLDEFPVKISVEEARRWIKQGKAAPAFDLGKHDKRNLGILSIGRGLDDYYSRIDNRYERFICAGYHFNVEKASNLI